MPVLGERVRHLYNKCLQERHFPPAWKEAKLVLFPKECKPTDIPSAYRSICLLDEIAKLLERVLVSRLVQHLNRVGSQLHGQQYGFRHKRSTIDAIKSVRAHVKSIMEEGRMLTAASLDIANVFNTLPWRHYGGR